MNTLRERLIWARARKSEREEGEFTQADLAARAGVTQGAIAHLESGRTLTSRSIAAIAVALGVDAVWLSTGKGDPFGRDIESGAAGEIAGLTTLLPGAMAVSTADPENPASVQIQKVELRLSAGITGFQTEPDRRDGGSWNLPRRWVDKNGFIPEKLLAIDVKGESMEPSLYTGDVVVINTADTKPVNGQVYAVNYEGEAVIKRLVRDGGNWYLHSDNASPRYPRRMCRGSECIIVGRVVRRETDQI
ncbi:XRE family transcriptional regulator [Massilia sp. GCM10020059]|uniref:Helix-turn-helix domain-containing protein n=1 Tax=Massilia agrisoli TaxID=2892444 RepID=A0ABS8IS69_9BURK|nr:LexA family transcriptional regulator [Massilia agrisoli]MCC6071439.1 helix-turn-helix domain-containing protein [Massilia agrisoli]